MFNTLFTSLVRISSRLQCRNIADTLQIVIFLGVFEQDLRPATLLAVPELYMKGQRSAGFNFKVYLGWMFMAVSEAVIIFFSMWGLWAHTPFSKENTLFPMGNMT